MRGDHDDLDRALAAMVDGGTACDELVRLLDVFGLALAIHASAEAFVFATLVGAVAGPRALQLIAENVRAEHSAQQHLSDALGATAPGSDEWYARALELRVSVLDHATRADTLRWTLQDHVPAAVNRRLASEYATERLRMLARTSPVAVARAQLDMHSR